MADNNRKCLGCGESYYYCDYFGIPDWAYTYCCEQCWSWSFRAVQLLALGNKIGGLLEPHERALMRDASEESHYLDKVLEGILMPENEDS